ncbi:hypothetical protein B296_00040966, partial [Ensete ventricosum]
EMMMMMMKRHHNPAFGDWDRWDDQRMSVRPAHHQHHQRKVLYIFLPKLSECCVLTLIAEDAAVELGVRMHGAQLHCLTKRERERERGCRSSVVRVKK